MARHSFRIFSAVLIAAACAAPLHAAQWRKLSTPRYTIYTHTSDSLTRDVASDFDDFIGFLSRIIVVDPRSLKPLTIVIFADDREFDPFKPRAADGRSIDYVSQELPDVFTGSEGAVRDGWAIIAMAAQDYEYQTRHAAFVAGVHWYLNGLGIWAPPAVGRGTAAMFATFKREITHVELGIAPPRYERLLDQWRLIPVAQLFQMTEDEAIEGHNRVLFNVESWAFAHYLMFAKEPVRRHAFTAFWQALRDGSTAEDALVKALGPEEAAAIDTNLRNYLHGMRYTMKVSVGEEPDNRDPIVLADPMEVEIALAKAAMISGLGSAVAHADAAVSASKGRPEAYDIRAEVLAASKPAPGLARQAVEEAIAHGSRSAWTVCTDATFQLGRVGNPGTSAQDARAAANLAERAANLDLRYRPAFDLLARDLVFADHLTDDDVKFLTFARARFPSDRWILIGQSAVCGKRGDTAGEKRLREQALSEGGGLDPSQLASIKAFVSGLEASGEAQAVPGGSLKP